MQRTHFLVELTGSLYVTVFLPDIRYNTTASNVLPLDKPQVTVITLLFYPPS